jgi:uncharacterized protein (DUF2141 family)
MTPLKTCALLLSTLWLAAAPHPAFAAATGPAAPDAASLTLSFTGLKTPSGRIMAALFDSEAAYAGRGKPARGVVLDVHGTEVTTTLAGLKPGRYALRAFHDVDGDGKMATNPFGMPTEPFAFSNNAKAVMGPASWADAAFEVPAAGAVQTITLD